jgi:signal transduction histidine kinase
MVTHEFRNPLAAILSSASILDKYDYRLTPESRNEKFERIYGQIRRMTNLLEDLLEVGELEHRALRFSPQRLDIVELIHDVYDEFRDSIGVDHNLIIQSNYPKIYTYADVQILRQALANIISNGIKILTTQDGYYL